MARRRPHEQPSRGGCTGTSENGSPVVTPGPPPAAARTSEPSGVEHEAAEELRARLGEVGTLCMPTATPHERAPPTRASDSSPRGSGRRECGAPSRRPRAATKRGAPASLVMSCWISSHRASHASRAAGHRCFGRTGPCGDRRIAGGLGHVLARAQGIDASTLPKTSPSSSEFEAGDRAVDAGVGRLTAGPQSPDARRAISGSAPPDR